MSDPKPPLASAYDSRPWALLQLSPEERAARDARIAQAQAQEGAPLSPPAAPPVEPPSVPLANTAPPVLDESKTPRAEPPLASAFSTRPWGRLIG